MSSGFRIKHILFPLIFFLYLSIREYDKQSFIYQTIYSNISADYPTMADHKEIALD